MKKNKGVFLNFLKRYWIIFVVVFIGQIIYLLYSVNYYKIGFPLDDSWIHQAYARNLLLFKDWYFVPGIKSAGSTSPLWTLLLVPGHLFRNDFFYFWTFLISGIIFSLVCIVSQKLYEVILGDQEKLPVVGLVIALEWHLMWATNSGMETILFILLILTLFLYMVVEKKYSYLISGILIGIIIFVRPDGITLLGPLFFILFYRKMIEKKKIINPFVLMAVILIFIAIFGFFNYRLSGEIFPNTFYAKQAEYEILNNQPILKRIFNLFQIPLTGAGIILLPGFLYFLYKKIKKFDIYIVSLYLWLFGYLLIYAIRLPVTYQHGRYLIPIIPAFFLLSRCGYNQLLQNDFPKKKLVVFGGYSAFATVLIIFFFLGAKAYGQDVAIIETEMVATAKWVQNNIDEKATIAAHDIGALGFYTDRNIIDLAGLINPEVIPFIRDEAKLKEYLDQKNVDFLVVFPGWYEELDDTKTEIYSSNGQFSPMLGGENMKIYIWK